MDPIHTPGCDEWCNHCEVCGVGILYGSRCPDHGLKPRPLPRVPETPDHMVGS